jgi:hypothetical protein
MNTRLEPIEHGCQGVAVDHGGLDVDVERILVGLLWFYVWADAPHIDVDVQPTFGFNTTLECCPVESEVIRNGVLVTGFSIRD